MSSGKTLRVVVVTPETTLFDKPASSLRVPLSDGSAGVLPGRAPLVSKLGFGELRVTNGEGTTRWFVEEGFVQVKGETVSVITSRATDFAKLDAGAAQKSLDTAMAKLATTAGERAARQKEIDRARQILAAANSAG
jgi:F-type H+-transporting ATPase subunit epsilon